MKCLWFLALLAAFPPFPCLHARAAEDAPPADVVPFAGLSPQEACNKASLPQGFKMHPFAAEPDLVQPIAFCLDHRGRPWVAEALTYPRRKGIPPPAPNSPSPDPSVPTPAQLDDIFGGKDRILIFEDTDGDHKFDRKTVFLENVNLISGLEIGFGGVYIGAAPYLLFVPVQDWDQPKPAGPPRILLDGWDYKVDTHETLNTFTWGPDGWLYGCHGVFCPSFVGKPGAPDSQRQWCDAGVWRFHPTLHTFEIFTEGGSNPWGVDFDEYGQCWIEMCVIPHLFHMIQGARIQRQGGEHYTIHDSETQRFARPGQRKTVHPHIYEDLQQHADHVHWSGAFGPHAANARSDAAGGGHAHAGLLCYLGASFPPHYRGQLLLGNIHGQRINTEIPQPRGSGFVGRHGPDFLNFNDSWSQTLNQLYDHDGSVFVIDWYDNNQCHHGREDGHDRSNGRLYKITYNNQKVSQIDLAKLSNEELLKLVPSKNEFMSRHARRLLQERAASIPLPASIHATLNQMLKDSPDSPARLRALWTLHVTGGFDAATGIENLRSSDEWIRAWTIQLAFDSSQNLERLVRQANEQNLSANPDLNQLAESDPSPIVRRFLASAAQRSSQNLRANLVKRLLQHSEDAEDHNLPLLIWFALEPLVPEYPSESLQAALDSKLPNILKFTTRRIASLNTPESRNLIASTLASLNPQSQQRPLSDMLDGLSAALAGQRNVPMPQAWPSAETNLVANANPGLRLKTLSLALTFGSSSALTSLRQLLANASTPTTDRRAALDALLNARDSQLPPLLQQLLPDPNLRAPAIRALAAYDSPETPMTLLAAYASFDIPVKRDALNTLAARPAYALQLLNAVASGSIPSKDLTADLVRQLRNLKNPQIQQQLVQIYGATRETSADKRAQIERYRNIYRAGGSQPGDAYRGRAVFEKVCAQCHVLFDHGGKVGPDITGANRTDLNYLLETILDPNAVVPNEYRSSEIETKDGRSLVGIIKSQNDQSLTLQSATELLALARSEITSQRQSELSMMPEDLLAQLTDQEVRDLLYYLGRPGQVPLLPNP